MAARLIPLDQPQPAEADHVRMRLAGDMSASRARSFSAIGWPLCTSAQQLPADLDALDAALRGAPGLAAPWWFRRFAMKKPLDII